MCWPSEMFTFTWLAAVAIMAASMSLGSAEPVFVVPPSSTVAVIGQNVILQCRVENIGDYDLFWYIDLDDKSMHPFAIGPFTNRNPTAYDRYDITGDATAGEYNLQISESIRGDSGDYSCFLSSGQNTVSAKATLIVAQPEPPVNDAPACSHQEPVNGTEGDQAAISCTSEGGRPPAMLRWSRGRAAIRGNYSTEVSSDASYTHNSMNSYRWSMTASDDGATYICTETHTALHRRRTCEVGPFVVRHKPVVDIRPPRYEAELGELATLRCSARANPSVSQPFVWTYNDTEIEMEDDVFLISNDSMHTTLTVLNVTEEIIGKRIYCVAINDLGSSNRSAVIALKPEQSAKRSSTNVMIIIVIIVSVTLVCVIGAAVFMHFASGATCCRTDKNRSKRQNAYEKENSRNTQDDLAVDLSQFEGGSNQTATEPPPAREVEPQPATPPPPPAPAFIPPPPPTNGVDNPSFEGSERANGIAEPQRDADPGYEQVLGSKKDSTSHRMKMARKKKRENELKGKFKPVEGDFPERLPDDNSQWIV